MTAKNQLTKQEAQSLFEYREGRLFWRHKGSGHRTDGLAIRSRGGRHGGAIKLYVSIGGAQLPAHYAVWNFHHGITSRVIVADNGDLSDTRIENLKEVEKLIAPPSRPVKISCPCCRAPVRVPTLDIIVDHYGLAPVEAKILEAVWKGKGMPVMSERIFNNMYRDDPDSGPNPTKMYAAMKVGMSHLRKKIEGSGVGVENCGYRRGYRLIIGGQ